ncbi:MAG: alpha/beta hydrolase [Chloroflexi bacterium]|nr:MAG: alpha/beta hydrolase [Chloroflexota bacterium]
MPFAELETGARLHYEDVGSGETILLIHGMLGTAQRHFPRVIEWLKTDYHIIGPSLRGYGQSTPKPRDFPHDFYQRDTRDVLALLDALNIEQAHLIGYSDGGEIALIAAGTQPDRFKSVTVWGAVGYFGPAMRPVVQRMYPATWITDEDIALHGIDNPDRFALEWINAAKYMIDSGGDVSLSLASKITAPLLMMLGKHDALNPEEYGRRFIEKTPNGRLEMFDCGHAVHDEAWETFQETVGSFLRQA